MKELLYQCLPWIRIYLEIGVIFYAATLALGKFGIGEPAEVLSTLIVIPLWPVILIMVVVLSTINFD